MFNVQYSSYWFSWFECVFHWHFFCRNSIKQFLYIGGIFSLNHSFLNVFSSIRIIIFIPFFGSIVLCRKKSFQNMKLRRKKTSFCRTKWTESIGLMFGVRSASFFEPMKWMNQFWFSSFSLFCRCFSDWISFEELIFYFPFSSYQSDQWDKQFVKQVIIISDGRQWAIANG